MGDFILYGLVLIHGSVLTLALVAYVVRQRHWRRNLVPPQDPIPVSIFKTLCGLDDDLESNLESFFNLEGDLHQLIFAVAHENDPALEVVRQLLRQHPDVDATVLVCPESAAKSPKVSLFIQMLPHAKYDLFWLSDSNTIVDPDDLDWGRVAFANPKIGLAHNPVVGINDQNWLASLESGFFTNNCGVISVAAKAVLNVDVIMGKSIFVRRQAMESIGGFESLGDVLADDQILGDKVREAAWETELIPKPAKTVSGYRKLSDLFSRHRRWSVLRFKIMPVFYPCEHLLRLVVLAALMFVTGYCSLTALVIVVLARGLFHFLGSLCLKPTLPSFGALLGIPLTEFFMAVVALIPFFSNRVKWRGTEYSVGPGSLIL